MKEDILNLKERYERLYSDKGIDHEQLDSIKQLLNVTLPTDFSEIAMFFSGGYLGGISNYSFLACDKSTNIIHETLRLREVIKLPERFIVLAEPPESLVVMDTSATPSIIWLDAIEVSKLENKSFEVQPDEWATYLEYFSELLEEEEEELGME